MYNLLTLVDQLDFICKRKRKSKSRKMKKKNLKKIFTMVESELFIQENRSQWPGGGTKYKPPLTQASVSRWAVSSSRR